MHGLQAFCIYAQCGEVAAKRGCWRLCIHGNYIVDHGISWNREHIAYTQQLFDMEDLFESSANCTVGI